MALSETDAAFLTERNLTFLFALRPDGSPTGWPMTSVLADGGLTFSSYAKAAKVRACLAAGFATALVVRRAGERITRAVCLSGPVRLNEAAGTIAGEPAADGPTADPVADPVAEHSQPGAARAIAVPARVRDRARAAAAEGKRAELVVDVAGGPRWSSGPAGEDARAQA